MRARFVRSARHVVAEARQQAARLGAPEVEQQHLLLALASEPTVGEVLARVLSDAGKDSSDLEHAVATAVHDRLLLRSLGIEVEPQALRTLPVRRRKRRPRYSRETIRSLHSSWAAAQGMRSRTVQTGHVLLGLLSTPGSGVGVLRAVGVDTAALRTLMSQRLAR